MNIGPHTFKEFKEKARQFHGYPAPGLLVGGYMVELARAALPEGTLFEAISESPKCLPDAVQLLTPCTIGNGWLRIVNLGRYALTLYDKYTGRGQRVWLDSAKLKDWPEIDGWYHKLKAKKDQDTDKLFRQIEEAGPNICSQGPVQVSERILGKTHMGSIAICPVCAEAYPKSDGSICRGCLGEAPYRHIAGARPLDPELAAVPVEESVGRRVLHDMTRIEPGQSKGPEFLAGQEITAGDLCALHRMGRSRVYLEGEVPEGDWIHENEAALAFARAMAGEGVEHDPEPREGKINFKAARTGLLDIDMDRLPAFNLVENVMCASRQNHQVVEAAKPFAATRAIPLYLYGADFARAMSVLGQGPLFRVLEMRPRKAGVLVTGSEVFQGLVEDRFAPVVASKLEALGSSVKRSLIVPDDREIIAKGVAELLQDGADLIVTTAGLSVDPDDVTRKGLLDAGLTDVLYGAPILPGAMTLVGRIGRVPVLGVPACALYHKITSLDLLLPRILAGVEITRGDLAAMADGGFCLGCRSCTYPKCPFGK